MSKLHFKYGAMNSGKTDTLIKTAFNYTEQGLEVIVIKPSTDVKGKTQLVTRSGNRRDVDILAAPDTNIRTVVKSLIKQKRLKKLSCVLIDETQFLTADQVNQLFDIAKIDNISVIAYGLRTDFLTNMFPGSKRLFELADNIEKLPTMCRCGSQAEVNCRKLDNEFVFNGNQLAIDGDGSISYESLCGVCFMAEKSKNQTKTQHSDDKNKRIISPRSSGQGSK